MSDESDNFKGLSDEEFLQEIQNKREEAAIISAVQNKIETEEMEDKVQPKRRPKPDFNIESYIQSHPNFEITSYIKFNFAELIELADLVSTKLHGWRGMHSSFTIPTQLFIALLYFSSNITIEKISPRLQIPKSSFHRVIKLVVSKYFPIFENEFLPQKLIPTEKDFSNYPSAAGALDTTTVPHYTPLRKSQQKLCYDYKHKKNGVKIQLLVNADGIAVHCDIEPNASIHDKRMFDNSDVKHLLIEKNGFEIETKKILVDKGYTGIDKELPKAMIMQKGEENKEINETIAQDRQIIERYNGRLKKLWNITSTGCRLDRSNIPDVMSGLVALTNFDIKHHPLNDDDLINPELTKKVESIKIDIEQNHTVTKSTKKDTTKVEKHKGHLYTTSPLDSLAAKKTRSQNPGYSLRHTSQFIGIHNQGLTCHINATLQVLFSFADFQRIIKNNASNNLQPSLAIHNIFLILNNRKVYKSYAAKTEELTNVLKDPQWLQMQPFDHTFITILDKIRENSLTRSEDPSKLYQINFIDKVTNKEHIERQIIYKNQDKSIKNSLLKTIKSNSKIGTNKMIFVAVSRDQDLKLEIPIENKLDFSDIANNESPKKYELKIIVAYNGSHYIIFKEVKAVWFVINDAYCYSIEKELIEGLKGGDSIECINLQKRLNGVKWVSCYLIYVAEGEELYY